MKRSNGVGNFAYFCDSSARGAYSRSVEFAEDCTAGELFQTFVYDGHDYLLSDEVLVELGVVYANEQFAICFFFL